MTEPLLPGAPGADSPAGSTASFAPSRSPTSTPRSDGRAGCRSRTSRLVCETVLAQLKALAAASFPPRERATIAEVLRELIAHLHTELARRYAGKGQPAVDRELEAAEQAIALWQGLWEQYSTCLKPLLEGDPELQGVKPKILQRGLYVGKQLVLAHGLARRAVPGSIWHELHAYYRLAEMLECAVTSVSDNLLPNAVGISCYSTYSHALLLGLADPCAMSVRQIELTDRWLAMWARKVFPYAQQRETEGPVILDRSRRRRRRGARAERAGRSGGVDALRLSRQARDQRARPPEAAAIRRQPGGAAARARLQPRAMHDAARPPRFALVPAAAAPVERRRRRRSSSARAGFRRRTSG